MYALYFEAVRYYRQADNPPQKRTIWTALKSYSPTTTPAAET